MRDFLENLEDAAEARFDEMTQGLPRGKFRCGCSNIEELDHAASASENPYSEPICRQCLQKMMNDAGYVEGS